MSSPSNFPDLRGFFLYSNVPGALGVFLTWLWGLNPITIMWCLWLGIQCIAFTLKWVRQERARKQWRLQHPDKTWPGDYK